MPEGAPKLDAISDRLMNRAAFRRLEGYDSLALTQTVDIDGDENAAIRWYELRDSGDGFEIANQGTFAPDDGNARWLGSAAMDAAGNFAVVYAVAGRGRIRRSGTQPGSPTIRRASSPRAKGR